jgi:hypothetical protein
MQSIQEAAGHNGTCAAGEPGAAAIPPSTAPPPAAVGAANQAERSVNYRNGCHVHEQAAALDQQVAHIRRAQPLQRTACAREGAACGSGGLIS